MTQRHIVFLLGAVVCFILGALLLPGLNDVRAQLAPAELADNASPELILATTALGGFRGLFATGVWWRAQELQNSGQYWELVQLYDWVGKLQPHLEEVWQFSGHNMAYNLPPDLKDPEERWRWVWRGIVTLRDKGLRYNQHSYRIPEEISWLFWQKIGREIDEYYIDYMQRLALMIDRDWGSGHPDLEAASKAPRDLEGLLKDKATAELIRLFRSEGVDLVENYDRLNELLPKVSDELQERFNDSSYAAARKLIQSFRVARVIREKYRMDPAKMVEIEKRYAPMDWRLPEPHAIYWAMVAVENRLGWGTEKEKKDTIDARRNICFSVETLYRRGTIVYMDKQPGGAFQFGMNLDFLDPYDRELGALVAEYTRTWERGAETIGDAQMNFWKEAMMMLYFAGQRTRALDFYSRLQKSYDRTEFRIYDIDSYVLGQIEKMVEEWGRTDKVEYMVDGILLQAYTYAVLNKPRLADNYGEQARRIWEFYRKDYLERKIHKEERSVKTFEELKKVVADRILAGQYPNVPPNIVEGLRQLLSEEKSGAAKTPPTSAAP